MGSMQVGDMTGTQELVGDYDKGSGEAFPPSPPFPPPANDAMPAWEWWLLVVGVPLLITAICASVGVTLFFSEYCLGS
jgi:hypothetical protein